MNLQEELKKVQARIKALADKADITEAEATELEELMVKSKSLKVRIEAQEIVAETAEADAVQAEIDRKAEAKELIAEVIAEGAPAINADAAGVAVTKDEADKALEENPFRNLADQCAAVKTLAQTQGAQYDVRLKPLLIKADGIPTKQLGGNVEIPSEGGFLLQPTLTDSILMPMHDEGPFTAAVQRLPVSGNSNYGWINGVDETDRATGSRWGGIRGYRLAEAADKTQSQPKFRRITWELKKYAVLIYETDELLQDAAMFETVVNIGAGEELSFMANDDILNGDGTGGPLGILTSNAKVSVTKESNQTAATVVFENLVKMWARLHSRAKMSSAWYINTDVNPQLDLLSIPSGTAALDPRFVGYDAQGLMRIKGRPVIETEFSATLGTQGDIMLADMSQYLFWEKGGVQAASSIHVQFLTDQTVFRFVFRCDGQPAIASPLTPYKGTGNTLSPFVVLDDRS